MTTIVSKTFFFLLFFFFINLYTKLNTKCEIKDIQLILTYIEKSLQLKRKTVILLFINEHYRKTNKGKKEKQKTKKDKKKKKTNQNKREM